MEVSKKEGLLLMNKPVGYSTFDLVKRFKTLTQYPGKIGHAGTLDPFASGLVVLLLGSFTKKFDDFKNFEKEYIAGIKVGYSSETLDVEGELVKNSKELAFNRQSIEEILPKFSGKISQKIPLYSAAKQDGTSFYKIADKSTIEERNKDIEISDLELIFYKGSVVSIRVVSSSGTYIRQLTYDIFNELGYESFLFYLQRTKIGNYDLKDALNVSDLKTADWEDNIIT